MGEMSRWRVFVQPVFNIAIDQTDRRATCPRRAPVGGAGGKARGDRLGAKTLGLVGEKTGRIAGLFLMNWWVPVASAWGGEAPAIAAPRNVLFIAIDDLGNVLGKNVPRTPHLDQLAATGVRFDRAYCQIPLCNPSRASVLTGRRPASTTVFDLDRHFRAALPEVITLPQLFRNQRWDVVRVGKLYHYDVPDGIGTNGLDDALSWDQVINPKGRDVADARLITNPTPNKKISAALSWLAAEGTDDEQTDGMIATEAIAQLAARRTRPFFLGVGFFRPHTPFVAPQKYFDLYPPESIVLATAPPEDRADIPAAALAHNNALPNYGLDESTCRAALRAYYASVSFVDAQVGRLLAALERLGLAENTIVVVWSDHGYHLGEHLGMWQKRSLFEESARAPLLIRAPGAKGNGHGCRQVVEFVDIYPTVADLCGVAPPAEIEGRSLRPLLENPERAWRGNAVTQILRPADERRPEPVMGRTVRTDRWRYTEWNEGRAGRELYDHANDPQEWINLAGSPIAPTVLPGLQSLLRAKAAGHPPTTPFSPARL